MKRHPLDALSFLFGLFFVGFALWVLVSDADSTVLRARWTWPLLFIAGAAVFIGSALESRRNEVADTPSGDEVTIPGSDEVTVTPGSDDEYPLD